MSDRRFFTLQEFVKLKEKKLVLPPEESHHAFSVLRLRKGDLVTVSDNKNVYEGIIELISERSATIKIQKRTPVRIPEKRVYLYQAIPKGRKIDAIVEKGTELGVDGFYFFKSDRSLGEITDKKLKRLERIAISASKQSKRDYLPVFAVLESVEGTLNSLSPEEMVIVFDEQKGVDFRKIDVFKGGKTRVVKYFIGPEGGFSDREKKLFEKSGAVITKLNSNILRTETASVVCGALILYKLGRI